MQFPAAFETLTHVRDGLVGVPSADGEDRADIERLIPEPGPARRSIEVASSSRRSPCSTSPAASVMPALPISAFPMPHGTFSFLNPSRLTANRSRAALGFPSACSMCPNKCPPNTATSASAFSSANARVTPARARAWLPCVNSITAAPTSAFDSTCGASGDGARHRSIPPESLSRPPANEPEEQQPPGNRACVRCALVLEQPRQDDPVVFEIALESIQPFALRRSNQPVRRTGCLIAAIPDEPFHRIVAFHCGIEFDGCVGAHGLEHLIERTRRKRGVLPGAGGSCQSSLPRADAVSVLPAIAISDRQAPRRLPR